MTGRVLSANVRVMTQAAWAGDTSGRSGIDKRPAAGRVAVRADGVDGDFIRGAPGAYLRVIRDGEVGAGGPVEAVSRPAHGGSGTASAGRADTGRRPAGAARRYADAAGRPGQVARAPRA